MENKSYQEAVADALTKRVERALDRFDIKSFSCAGGVSLNKVLREKLTALSEKTGVPLLLCPPSLCTDNAAMIAGAAYEKIRLTGNNYLARSHEVSGCRPFTTTPLSR